LFLEGMKVIGRGRMHESAENRTEWWDFQVSGEIEKDSLTG